MRIIYMGTPEFAIPPLKALIGEKYDIAAVVTAPDKPAGRGKKIQPSPVKAFAEEHNIPVLQPVKLKDPGFIHEMEELQADLQVVVAFRMLPEIIWNMPPLGTFNLHASLLPQYRGAAPINWVIINGEKETGLTTFMIDKEIDTGKILFREKTTIGNKETAGELHDRLMEMGAGLVLKTIKAIANQNIKPLAQEELINEQETLKTAPKIFKEDCQINWENKVQNIYNFIRGLSPYPAAFGTMEAPGGNMSDMKIYNAEFEEKQITELPGTIVTDHKKEISVAAEDGYIHIIELQMPGKKKMDSGSFLRGFKGLDKYCFVS